MAFYKVLLNAENFLICIDHMEELHGFYTIKFVQAENEEEAELKAVDLIKNDKELHEATLNKKRNIDLVPMIYLEEINEISKHELKNDHGKTWYPMKNED
jgi:hypothetical protein